MLALCHFDGDVSNNDDSNLFIWCQRCHLCHDVAQHVRSRKYGSAYEKYQLKLRIQQTLPFSTKRPERHLTRPFEKPPRNIP